MSKFFKSIILTTCILVTATFFVFKKPADNNVVVFWTLQMSDFATYINEVIENFEKENPEIHIKWVDVPFSRCGKSASCCVFE